jgi:hypothetical protein
VQAPEKTSAVIPIDSTSVGCGSMVRALAHAAAAESARRPRWWLDGMTPEFQGAGWERIRDEIYRDRR